MGEQLALFVAVKVGAPPRLFEAVKVANITFSLRQLKKGKETAVSSQKKD